MGWRRFRPSLKSTYQRNVFLDQVLPEQYPSQTHNHPKRDNIHVNFIYRWNKSFLSLSLKIQMSWFHKTILEENCFVLPCIFLSGAFTFSFNSFVRWSIWEVVNNGTNKANLPNAIFTRIEHAVTRPTNFEVNGHF